ncbi:MAG: MFS transporter, partial [Acetobacteraceae bacterium]|nr:MFS transporter [Acetobacteraceae bacterium]
MNEAARGDLRRVLLARGLRAFGDGFAAILLPVHLSLLGFAPLAVGAITTAALLGSSLLALGLGLLGHRLRRRATLVAASLLMAATGLGFAALDGFWPLLVVAFVGTLSPTGGDTGVFLPIEHTVLAGAVADQDRTAGFARYSLVGSLVGAVGALAAGAVDWLAPWFSPRTVIEALFLLYAALGLAAGLLYRGLSPAAERAADQA